MFGKRKQRGVNPGSTDTLIGEATVVEGKIISKAGLRVEGTVDGEIECAGDLTIGPTGKARSTIIARNVVNSGTIEGSVTATELLHVLGTGTVTGDVRVGAIVIAQGGVFNGSSRMETGKQPQAVKKEQAAEQKRGHLSKPEKATAAN